MIEKLLILVFYGFVLSIGCPFFYLMGALVAMLIMVVYMHRKFKSELKQ